MLAAAATDDFRATAQLVKELTAACPQLARLSSIPADILLRFPWRDCEMERGEKRILVIDDDDAIRALLFTLLRRRGFRIDTARDGVEALEHLARCRYSAILLDLMMPRMSGYEFLARLEKLPRREHPIVVVLTAGAEPHNLSPSLVAGTIHKPFDIDLLIDSISACLSTVGERPQVSECPPSESDTSDGSGQSRDEPN